MADEQQGTAESKPSVMDGEPVVVSDPHVISATASTASDMDIEPVVVSDPHVTSVTASTASHLFELPHELLTLIVLALPFRTLDVLMRTNRQLRAIAGDDSIWKIHIDRFIPDLVLSAGRDAGNHEYNTRHFACGRSRRELFFSLVPVQHRCSHCDDTLVLPDTGGRCPCITRRTPLLQLRVGSLCAARSGSSALSTAGGFTSMQRCLRRNFEVSFDELAVLDDATLAPLDVLILCTTEGPALAPAELAALRAWLERGGALITSAFANWSAYEHYAASAVGFLGLVTQPRTRFLPRLTHTLDPSEASRCAETRRLLEAGAWGHPKLFRNQGESFFTTGGEQHDAFAAGGVQLITRVGRSGQDLAPHRIATLMYYPPKPRAAGGVTGKGRALVCSNYHWLADQGYWNGGTFEEGPDQEWLLLNFVAQGVAARVGRVVAG